MNESENIQIKASCPYCYHEYSDVDNVTSIEETGSCLNCDHLLGEVIEAQAGEPMYL